jgi:hypothetical protein
MAGKILFDVTEGGRFLEEFSIKNRAEFYGDIIVRGRNGFGSVDQIHGRKVWVTWHKHKAKESEINKLRERIPT